VQFTWSAGVGPTAYELFLGTDGKGSSNLYHSGSTTATTVTVPSIPADLMTVYAYLCSDIGGAEKCNSYTYKEGGTPTPAVLQTPTQGSTLGTTNVKFTWSAGVGATAYELFLGTEGTGSSNLYHSGKTTATTVTVPSIPADLSTVYAYLCSEIGTQKCTSATYKEGGTPTPAVIETPTQGSTLGTTDVSFTWNTGVGVAQYELFLGTSGPGSSNLYYSGKTTDTTVTVPSLPSTGATVYAYFCSEISGSWKCADYTYKEQ
jgi:hypothetical protein